MCPVICAEMHCDKHVIKLILETAQMLCVVWHVSDPEHKIYDPPYKKTHLNHPCTKWARTSIDNYEWLCKLGKELCKEYTYRYGKVHKCEQYINIMAELNPNLPSLGFTIPPQALPETYKDDDVVTAYRHYYFFEKYNLHSWKGKINGRNPPEWITEMYGVFGEKI